MTASLVIVGCGKLGLIAGSMLSKLPIEVIGIRRNIGLLKPPFKIYELNIFSKYFLEQLHEIGPTYIIYSVSADSPSEDSYLKNYYEGLKLTINAVSNSKQFKHLLFISSTRVYGQKTNAFLSEDSIAVPNDYRGKALLRAEKLLDDVKFNSSILRLSGIYGNDRSSMLKIASDVTRWPKTNRWTNRIHEVDAALFILYLFKELLKGNPLQKVYLVTDNMPVPIFELLSWLRNELGLDFNKSLLLDKIEAGRIDGKKLRSQILPHLDFVFKYESYKLGYSEIIKYCKLKEDI